MSALVNDYFTFSLIFQTLLYAAGFLYLARHYWLNRMRSTLLLSLFFIGMALGSFLNIFIVDPVIDVSTGVPLALKLGISISIIAETILLVSGLELIGETRKWPLVAIYGGLLVILTLFIIPADFFLIFQGISLSAMAFPIILLFGWGYWKTRSGKALGFSMGMTVLVIMSAAASMGTSVNYALMGTGFIVSTIIVHAGLFGWIDRLIKKQETPQLA